MSESTAIAAIARMQTCTLRQPCSLRRLSRLSAEDLLRTCSLKFSSMTLGLYLAD